MLFIFVGLKLWRRQWSGIRIWLLAMSLLVLFDPWAIFSTGFWLSFLAVAVLALSSFLWKKASMLRIQIFITLMLLPVQLLWFHGVSITSVFTNILAGPCFSFSIIPLSVLGGFIAPIFPVIARYCFYMSDWQLQQLFNLLHVTDDYFSGWMSLSETQTRYVLWILVSVLILFIVRTYRKSVVLVVSVSGLVLVGCEQKPLWRIDFIDVGQGLAVLVSQDNHGLLFDTGDVFPSGFNMADAAIFPVLSYRGIQYLDYLIISHKDRDHSGNWEKISQRFPQAQIISSAQLSPETTICKKNMVLRWQQLVMHVVSPVESKGGDHNEDSCVIRISDGNKSVLLTGVFQGSCHH